MEPLSTQSAKTSMLALLALWQAVTSAWLATPIPQWRRDHSITDLIQGNGPIEAWRRDNERCIEYSDHTVIETNSDALKNTIAIYPATFKCREAGAGITIAAIFTRQGEAESFSGLIGDVLVTDTGTGTDGRILTLYSISKKSKLTDFFDYSDPVELTDRTKLLFWLPAQRATTQTCREYGKWRSMGLGAVIEVRVFVDLRSNNLYKTSHYRCGARQVPVH